MNKREADWIKEAQEAIRNGDLPDASRCLEESLKVRTALTVCEKCLRIGGCEDCNGNKKTT